MDETWLPIPDIDGYVVSNLGRIRSIDRTMIRRDGKPLTIHGKELTQIVSNAGYKRVHIRNETRGRWVSVHRAVAMAFIPNVDGKREVNHKNGDKFDNSVENLEWVTPVENARHKYATGLGTYADMSAVNEANKKPVTVDGDMQFGSITEAAAYIGCTESSACQAARGRYRTVKGHTIKYTKEV